MESATVKIECPKCGDIQRVEAEDFWHDTSDEDVMCYKCGHVWRRTSGLDEETIESISC